MRKDKPVYAIVEELRASTSKLLKPVATCTQLQLQTMFLVYAACIGSSFRLWMSPVLKSWSQLPLPRDSLCGNHTEALERLVTPIRMNSDAILQAAGITWKMWRLVKKLDLSAKNPLEGLTLLTALEHASLDFLPWMHEAAEHLGLQNLQYLDARLAANADHASSFLTALEGELKQQTTPQRITPVFRSVLKMLTRIFRSSLKVK